MSDTSGFDFFDRLFRSRRTLLRILAERGYNTKPFEKFGIDELTAMVTSAEKQEAEPALRMDLEKSSSPDSSIVKCHVLYKLQKAAKSKLATDIFSMIQPGDDSIDPKTTEIIIMLSAPDGEPGMDAFNKASYDAWTKHKLRISYFRMANLVIHPSEHILVPKHEKVPRTEIPFSSAEKTKLPLIKFHEDMQARVLGLVPGDVVKITRASPASGVYKEYRICSP